MQSVSSRFARAMLVALLALLLPACSEKTPTRPAPPSTSLPESPPVLVRSWGTLGGLVGQLNHPMAIAIRNGVVYVTDTGNHRIQKFSTTGAELGEWGVYGSGPGQFSVPQGIAVSAAGDVYVSDLDLNRVQRLTAGGQVLPWIAGTIAAPQGVAWGPDRVLTVESGAARVLRLLADGTADGSFGSPGPLASDLGSAACVAVGQDGSIFVTDPDSARVHRFTAAGEWAESWGGRGTEPAAFQRPFGVAVDTAGCVYVSDIGSHEVKKFTPHGSLLTRWGGHGDTSVHFYYPCGIALDANGHVYVADTYNNRIMEFRPAR